MPYDFYLKTKEYLTDKLDVTFTNDLFKRYSYLIKSDSETAYGFLMAIIPDLIGRVGLNEGLTMGQEIREIYNRERYLWD